LTGGLGEEGEGGGGWKGGGGWVIYHLLGCVLPPPAHAEKTHNNKHSQDTELMDSWPEKFLEKGKIPSYLLLKFCANLRKQKAFL
jgi:hypothetical protein